MTLDGLYILLQPKAVCVGKVAAIALNNKDFRRVCECMNVQVQNDVGLTLHSYITLRHIHICRVWAEVGIHACARARSSYSHT